VVERQDMLLAVTISAANVNDCQMLEGAVDARLADWRAARRGIESKQRLGGYRGVAKRPHAWRKRFCCLKIRYEREPAKHRAFLEQGCARICWRFL
jgi:hypothetical protein